MNGYGWEQFKGYNDKRVVVKHGKVQARNLLQAKNLVIKGLRLNKRNIEWWLWDRVKPYVTIYNYSTEDLPKSWSGVDIKITKRKGVSVR